MTGMVSWIAVYSRAGKLPDSIKKLDLGEGVTAHLVKLRHPRSSALFSLTYGYRVNKKRVPVVEGYSERLRRALRLAITQGQS